VTQQAKSKPPTQLRVTVQGRVAVLELDGPGLLNALHSTTHKAIQRAFDELDDRDDVGAILLCGAGSSFCSGSDLGEIGPLHGEDIMRHVRLDFTSKNRVAGSVKPVVAAIHGYCVGGGVELALACDIRIAAEDAKFSMREVSLGGIPGSGGLQRLPQVVGLGVAKDWVLTGRDVDVKEAYDRALVTQVLPVAGFRERALVVAAQLAEFNPAALRLAKVALDPNPESDRGLVAAYQVLAGTTLHDDPNYEKRAQRFSR
jgi:enoyl-CoA hydratase/carnithine racemase